MVGDAPLRVVIGSNPLRAIAGSHEQFALLRLLGTGPRTAAGVTLVLALLASGRPALLVLDEPTNHLDLPTIVWLERWLKSYTGILLLISHDRDFLDGLCTHIAHIEHQAVKTYTGNYSQFEAVRAEQLALQQVMYTKQQKEIKHMESFVERFRYKASKAKQAQSRLKMLERLDGAEKWHFEIALNFKKKKYSSSIRYLNALVAADNHKYSQEALELLGMARQRKGQYPHAVDIYERYLERYPEGPASDRVRQRLAGLAGWIFRFNTDNAWSTDNEAE